jgi:DNA repair ATPase RecN/predicted phosphodiesterase
MSKLLIISDIHINDYKDYNFIKHQRLDNYKVYIQEILRIAKENKCEYLAIAGDTNDAPTLQSYIYKYVKELLYEFSRAFKDVFVILGQHDTIKTSGRDHIDSDSYIALECVGNIHYMDKKVIRLENTEIAFMDYYKEQDLSWLDHKVDLFIGHLTISSLFGQEIDTTKFTEAICGDIHYPIDLGNLHSIGCQVQRNYSDSENTTCVIYDLETHGWFREPIDPDHELFMRLRTTNNELESGFSKELNSRGLPKYYYRYVPIIQNQDKVEELTAEDLRGKTIQEAIESLISTHNCEHAHHKVLEKFEDTAGISLDFQILKLEIENFKSIDKLEIDFTKYSNNLMIIGENGSGKSSIIDALYYVLVKGRDFESYIRDGESYCKLVVTLKYYGIIYQIWKDTEGLWFGIVNEEGITDWIAYNCKRDCEADIKTRLPFIEYIDSYFFGDQSSSIFSSFGVERKIQLLSTYYRLDIIDKYVEISEMLKSEEGTVWYSLDDKQHNLERELLEFNKEVERRSAELNSKYSNRTIEDIQEDIRVFQLQYKENEELKAKIAVDKKNKELHTKLQSDNIVNQNRVRSYINETQKSIDNILVKYDNKEIIEIPEVSEDTISEEIKRQQDLFSRYNVLKSSIETLDKSLKSTSTINCPNCNYTIELVEGLVFDRTNALKQREVYIKEISEITRKYSEIQKEIADLKDKRARYLQIKADKEKLDVLRGTYNTYSEQLDSLVREGLRIKSVLESIEEYSKPEDSSKILENIRYWTKAITEIEAFEDFKKSKDIKFLNQQLDETIKLKDESNTRWYEFDNYSKLLSKSGILYKNILEYIVSTFSSDKFKYSIIDRSYRGSSYFDIDVAYRAEGSDVYRTYWKLSRGQKTLCDLDFLRNMITKVGIVVFDEYLKFLDAGNQLIGQQLINQMNAGLKIITIQNDNAPYIENKIYCEYNGKVTTVAL